MKRFLIAFMRLFGYITVEEAAARDLASIRRSHDIMSGERCWICKEQYVGMAMDCACTNWGR